MASPHGVARVRRRLARGEKRGAQGKKRRGPMRARGKGEEEREERGGREEGGGGTWREGEEKESAGSPRGKRRGRHLESARRHLESAGVWRRLAARLIRLGVSKGVGRRATPCRRKNMVTNFNKALKKSQRTAMINGGVAEVTSAVVAEDSIVQVNGDVPTSVDNGDEESKNPVKSTTMAEQMDEYVDIGDEMPTATYQSMEIEKDAEVASGSGGSSSGSSSSSGSESECSGDTASGAGNAHSLV